jgi:hypothetical protein
MKRASFTNQKNFVFCSLLGANLLNHASSHMPIKFKSFNRFLTHKLTKSFWGQCDRHAFDTSTRHTSLLLYFLTVLPSSLLTIVTDTRSIVKKTCEQILKSIFRNFYLTLFTGAQSGELVDRAKFLNIMNNEEIILFPYHISLSHTFPRLSISEHYYYFLFKHKFSPFVNIFLLSRWWWRKWLEKCILLNYYNHFQWAHRLSRDNQYALHQACMRLCVWESMWVQWNFSYFVAEHILSALITWSIAIQW